MISQASSLGRLDIMRDTPQTTNPSRCSQMHTRTYVVFLAIGGVGGDQSAPGLINPNPKTLKP